MNNQFWQEYRAALIARVKALETERAAVLRIIRAIEKQEVEAERIALMTLEIDVVAITRNLSVIAKVE